MSYQYNQSLAPCMNSVIADGKPHKKKTITVKTGITDISPRKLILPESGAVFDLCTALAGHGAYEGSPWIADVPVDMPGRDMFDKATAFAALAEIPAVKCEIDREYYIDQGGTSESAYVEGQILVCAADGVLAIPGVAAGTTIDVFGIFGFEFIDYSDTNEIIVKYLGRVSIDNSA